MPDAEKAGEDQRRQLDGEPSSVDVWITAPRSEASSGSATVTTHPRAKRRRDVRIGNQEPLAVALQRVCLEQLDRARLALTEADLDEGIHTARKAMKRIRAILRLSRDEVGERVYKTENVILRDAARVISPVRDAAVAIETLDILANRYGNHLAAELFDELRSELVARHSAQHEIVLSEGSLRAVIAVIEAARIRFADWPTGPNDPWGRTAIRNEFGAIAPGVRRTYRRGRRAMHRTERDGSIANYHEWRKRAKYLRYQLETLVQLWPTALSGTVRTIDDLGELLGTEHDLALLAHMVQSRELKCDPETRRLVLALTSDERTELQQRAAPLGARIYAESPDRF
ncbi:MAG: CHAD domain-containing protein, partial [Acidimicrobiia bacterium]